MGSPGGCERARSLAAANLRRSGPADEPALGWSNFQGKKLEAGLVRREGGGRGCKETACNTTPILFGDGATRSPTPVKAPRRTLEEEFLIDPDRKKRKPRSRGGLDALHTNTPHHRDDAIRPFAMHAIALLRTLVASKTQLGLRDPGPCPVQLGEQAVLNYLHRHTDPELAPFS